MVYTCCSITMEVSAKVLRERVKNILGELSPSDKENRDRSPVSTALATPVLRASNVRDIIAIVESERSKRSVGNVLGMSLRKLEDENERLLGEIESLHNRLIESESHLSQKAAEQATKHARHLSVLQNEHSGLKEEIDRITKERDELNCQLVLKYKRDEERFRTELGRAKAAFVAKEKENRKKWQEEIRSQTAKAVEPEIQRIIESHRVELEVVTDTHINELKSLEESIPSLIAAAVETERREHSKRETELFDEFKSQIDDARMHFKSLIDKEVENSNQIRRQLNEALSGQMAAEDALATQVYQLREKETQLHDELTGVIKEMEVRHSRIIEEINTDWTARYDEACFERDMFEKKLEIGERDKDIFQARELALLEESVRDVLNEKNREIDQLVERIAFLESKREIRFN